MKKLTFFLTLLVLFGTFGCNENEIKETPQNDEEINEAFSKAPEVLIPKEELPEWLITMMDFYEAGWGKGPQWLTVYRCTWNGSVMYFLNIYGNNCGMCEVYFESGEKIDWRDYPDYVEGRLSFRSEGKDWLIIYRIGPAVGGFTTRSGFPDIARLSVEDKYEFPDISGMNDWGRPGIIQERKAALQIPENVLAGISTAGLLETCLEYPYLIDIHFFNDYQQGFNALTTQFNGFRELLKRPDLVNVLLGKYYQLTEDVKSVHLMEFSKQGRFSFRHFTVEFILAQDVVIDNLNAEQERELFLLNFKHRKIKSSYPNVYSGLNDIPVYLLYAKTVMRNNAAGDYADELSKLIKAPSGRVYDQNMLKYLDDYINNKFKQL